MGWVTRMLVVGCLASLAVAAGVGAQAAAANGTHTVVLLRSDLSDEVRPGERQSWSDPVVQVSWPSTNSDRIWLKIDETADGGGEIDLTIMSNDGPLAVGDTQDDAELRVSISHTGCGEAEEFLIREVEVVDDVLVRLAVDAHNLCSNGVGQHLSIRIGSSVPADAAWIDDYDPFIRHGRVIVAERGDDLEQGRLVELERTVFAFSDTWSLQLDISQPDPFRRQDLLRLDLDGVAPPGPGRYDSDDLPSTFWSLEANDQHVGCGSGDLAWLDIHEWETDRFGVVTSLAVDLMHSCGDAMSIRLASDHPVDQAWLDSVWFKTFAELRPSDCPFMTDSILRLYTAYFGREPDLAGYDYWVGAFGRELAGLPTMSQAFADSEEFRVTYGSLDNAQFVDLVYRNVLGREPDPAGLDHWVRALDSGYPRGSVMIAFSESEEYVIRTETAPSLAGYLQWYGHHVVYTCGTWNNVDLGVGHLDNVRADLLLVNPTNQPIGYEFAIRGPNGGKTDVLTVEPDSYVIWWDVPVSEWVPGAWTLHLSLWGPLEWTMVAYDGWPGPWRSPYTDFVQFGDGQALVSAGPLRDPETGVLSRSGTTVAESGSVVVLD